MSTDAWFDTYAAGGLLPDVSSGDERDCSTFAEGYVAALSDDPERLRNQWWNGYAAALSDIAQDDEATGQPQVTEPCHASPSRRRPLYGRRR